MNTNHHDKKCSSAKKGAELQSASIKDGHKHKFRSAIQK